MTNSLNHYLQLWNLSNPEPLSQTPRGDVYAVDQNGEKVVLKLFTAEGAEDESEGTLALRYFDGQGAVRLLAHDGNAQLQEYAGDEELTQWVWRGDDLEAAQTIADVLNKLHRPQPDVPVPPLRNLRLRFRSLFEKAKRDQAVGESSIYVRGARAAEYLLSTPQDECVLHGDIQHHNIRRHPVRGWLAYDPKGLYGERSYDAANTLCNPSNARERVLSEDRFLQVSQVLANGMGVHVTRLRTFGFAYACLSASWFGDDGDLDRPPLTDNDSDAKLQILAVAHNAERHIDINA
jgi:streptomycin 6-kinase